MKIGILTFHRAQNYGAVLQCFALQEHLRLLGHDVVIIDYRQPFIEKTYLPFSLERCKNTNPLKFIYSIFNELYSAHYRIKRKNIFRKFNSDFLRISNKVSNNYRNIPTEYDLYIHGSDQIWNPKLLGGYDNVFMGGYNATSGKKITYAASFELKPLDKEGISVFSKHMNMFDGISLREKLLIDIVSPFVNKKIYNVLDPTLLVAPDIWDKLTISPPEKKYVLIYQVGISPVTNQLANKIAKQIGGIIINLNSPKKIYSVNQFVGYFKYASFVVATSFHATTFSIIFKKPFYTVASGTSSDVRYISLLSSLGLEDRIVKNAQINPTFIDYSLVPNKLQKLRNDSNDYLNKYLDSSYLQVDM
jgi:hypothetical protein